MKGSLELDAHENRTLVFKNRTGASAREGYLSNKEKTGNIRAYCSQLQGKGRAMSYVPPRFRKSTQTETQGPPQLQVCNQHGQASDTGSAFGDEKKQSGDYRQGN